MNSTRDQQISRDEFQSTMALLEEIRGDIKDDISELKHGQTRLSEQLTQTTLTITTRQDEANGRTGKNEAALRVVCAEVEKVQKEVLHLEKFGCRNLSPHQSALGALTAVGVVPQADAGPWRPSSKQVGIGAGLAGIGAIVMKLAEVLLAWIQHLGGAAK